MSDIYMSEYYSTMNWNHTLWVNLENIMVRGTQLQTFIEQFCLYDVSKIDKPIETKSRLVNACVGWKWEQELTISWHEGMFWDYGIKTQIQIPSIHSPQIPVAPALGGLIAFSGHYIWQPSSHTHTHTHTLTHSHTTLTTHTHTLTLTHNPHHTHTHSHTTLTTHTHTHIHTHTHTHTHT